VNGSPYGAWALIVSLPVDSGPFMSTGPCILPRGARFVRDAPRAGPRYPGPGTADGSRARTVVTTNVWRIVGEADVAPEMAPFIAAAFI
jgi:hypothetical protein